MNIKFGICHWSVPVEGPFACKIAAELGISGIQLEMNHPEKEYPLSKEFLYTTYLEEAEKYGIEFPSIVVGTTRNFSLTGYESTYDYKVVKETIKIAIDTAGKMNIPSIMVPSFGKSNMTTISDIQRTAKVLRWACDYATEKNILVTTENLLSVEENVLLFNEVNSGNLKLYMDTQNYFLRKGYHTADYINSISHLLGNEVHVKDGIDGQISSALLGKGDSGFKETVETLKLIEYSGWLILENYYDRKPLSQLSENPLLLIKQDMDTLKGLFCQVER